MGAGFGYTSAGSGDKADTCFEVWGEQNMFRFIAITAAVACIGLCLAPSAVAAPGPVYANCTEAREAGDTDILVGSDAYWEDGDRDGDGIACESYSG